jgi:hypothetical protein
MSGGGLLGIVDAIARSDSDVGKTSLESSRFRSRESRRCLGADDQRHDASFERRLTLLAVRSPPALLSRSHGSFIPQGGHGMQSAGTKGRKVTCGTSK